MWVSFFIMGGVVLFCWKNKHIYIQVYTEYLFYKKHFKDVICFLYVLFCVLFYVLVLLFCCIALCVSLYLVCAFFFVFCVRAAAVSVRVFCCTWSVCLVWYVPVMLFFSSCVFLLLVVPLGVSVCVSCVDCFVLCSLCTHAIVLLFFCYNISCWDSPTWRALFFSFSAFFFSFFFFFFFLCACLFKNHHVYSPARLVGYFIHAQRLDTKYQHQPLWWRKTKHIYPVFCLFVFLNPSHSRENSLT